MLKRNVATLIMKLRKISIFLNSFKIFSFFLFRIPNYLILSFYDYILVRTFGTYFIEFELSNKCNASCIFCFYPEIKKSNKTFLNMNKDTFYKAVELIKKQNYNFISFTPTTGDIFMNPDWDFYFYEMTKVKQIKQITFYSNAILLEKRNRNKLIELLKKDTNKKIFALLFSVGGADKDTYNFMFGVDKFDVVVENLNALQKQLIEENIVISVNIELRVHKNYKVDKKFAKSIFNKNNYYFTSINILNEYMSNNQLEKVPELKYLPDKTPTNKACSYLKKTRYAADGGVWADGCVVSESPNDESLKLGSVNDSINKIEQKRNEIISNWENKNEIPLACQGCTWLRYD